MNDVGYLEDARRRENQRPGRFCRRRRSGSCLPPGDYGRGFRLHGRDRRREVSGSGTVKLRIDDCGYRLQGMSLQLGNRQSEALCCAPSCSTCPRANFQRNLSEVIPGAAPRGRFIAGENLEDAVGAVRALNDEGFDVTLDYLGESVHDAAAAEEACQVYLGILDRLAADGLRSHISIKLTQLGLALDEALARRHLRGLARARTLHHNFVRIDMESSAHTDSTLRVFREVTAPRDVLGMVIQSYLYRSEKDVEELLKCGARSPPGAKAPTRSRRRSPSLARRMWTRNFVKLMEMLLASGSYHAIATHDGA